MGPAVEPLAKGAARLKEQLLKRFEEVKPRPGEAAAWVDRMQNGTFREADRQRLLEMREAAHEMLEMLATCPSSPGKRARHGQAKRRRQLAKVSRRRHRRSGSVTLVLVSLRDQRGGAAMRGGQPLSAPLTRAWWWGHAGGRRLK